MTRDELFANLKAGARWDVGVSINRSNSLPLDANSIFESYEAAVAYASKDDAAIATYGFLNNAYIGQIIAVVGEDAVGIYYIDQNLTLQPVGKEVVLDKVSVVTNESGAVQIYGFEAAAASTYPRKTADGKIEWVTVNELVEGATENTVTVGDGKSLTSETTDTGYKLALAGYAGATNGQVPFASKVAGTDGQTTETIVWKDVYTKSEVDAKVAGMFSYKGAAAGAPTDEGKNILVGDTTITASSENIGHVYIYNGKEYVSNGAVWEELGFELDLSGYYTKTETDAAIDADVAVEKERAEAVETELAGRLNALEAYDHSTYAIKTEVDEAITAVDEKAVANASEITSLKTAVNTNTGDIAILKSTVEGHDNSISTLNTEVGKKVAQSDYDAYVEDRQYTDTQIDEAIAAEGVAALKTRVTTLETTVGSAESGLVKDANDAKASITTLTNEVGTLKTQNTTILAKIGELESTDSTHTADIAALKISVADHTTALGGLTGTVKSITDANAAAAAEAKTAADNAAAAVTALETGKVATNTTNITALGTRVTSLEETVGGLSGAMKFVGVFDALPDPNQYEAGNVVVVGSKEYILNPNTKLWEEFGDASDFYTKDQVYTKTEVETKISEAMSWSDME